MESSQILVSIFCLLFSLVLISISAGFTVHVDYEVQDNSQESLPDEINATIVDESGTSTFLQLQRAKHIVPNIPVYTMNVDKEGKFFSRREILQETQNVGYYQDVNSEAALQVRRMDEADEKSNRLILRGELNIGGHRYRLEHGTAQRKREAGMTASPDQEYSLEHIPEVAYSDKDFIVSSEETEETTSSSTPSETRRVERQTSGPTKIYIDLVAVADYASYKLLQSDSRSRDENLQWIREYYAFVINGVDMRYGTIKSTEFAFQVNLAKLIIAETGEASNFTENFRLMNINETWIDAHRALDNLTEFVSGPGKSVASPYDHVMLFTGYIPKDVNKTTGAVTGDVNGIANSRATCTVNGTSLVRENGGLQYVRTASHELGHSLSARHDGDNNTCKWEDYYILNSGGTHNLTDSNKYNTYYFSNCSINYFENYIRTNLQNTTMRECFLNPLPVCPDLPDVSGLVPGQVYSPDQICRKIYGNSSFLCRTNDSDFCLEMKCWTGTWCRPTITPDGTTCGNGKLCLFGKCVSDSRAPAVDDNCPWGEQPRLTFNNQTCEQYINGLPGRCYHNDTKTMCCDSCKKVFRNVPGCEYGDTASWCTPKYCPNPTDYIRERCCATCNTTRPEMPS